MEMIKDEVTLESPGTVGSRNDCFDVSCNWQICNERALRGTLTSVSLAQAPERTNLEDIVSLDTCIALRPISSEPCVLDIKVKNCQKIARIAIVSEASVLEFFKQYGEYETTVFAEFIDKFEGNSVYYAETGIDPPTSEASVKFAKLKTEGPMTWVYGVRLILTEPSKQSDTNMFNHEIIKNFLASSNGSIHNRFEAAVKLLRPFANQTNHVANENDLCQKTFKSLSLDPMNNGQTPKETDKEDTKNQNILLKSDIDIKTYIDNEFHNMESRLMQKISDMEYRINQKFDAILKTLDTSLNRNEV